MYKKSLLLLPLALGMVGCNSSEELAVEENNEVLDAAIADAERMLEELESVSEEEVAVVLEEKEEVIVSNNTLDMEVTELQIEILEEGKGNEAGRGDTLRMHYIGTLLDGSKFDSSVDRGQPFQFTLGVGEVIRGWDEGVLGMKEGEKRKLTIPYDMAYGERGFPPVIPPKSPLVFEIELLEVVK